MGRRAPRPSWAFAPLAALVLLVRPRTTAAAHAPIMAGVAQQENAPRARSAEQAVYRAALFTDNPLSAHPDAGRRPRENFSGVKRMARTEAVRPEGGESNFYEYGRRNHSRAGKIRIRCCGARMPASRHETDTGGTDFGKPDHIVVGILPAAASAPSS